MIEDGQLDYYLTLPKNVLFHVLIKMSYATSGDFVFSFILAFTLLSAGAFPLLGVAAVLFAGFHLSDLLLSAVAGEINGKRMDGELLAELFKGKSKKSISFDLCLVLARMTSLLTSGKNKSHSAMTRQISKRLFFATKSGLNCCRFSRDATIETSKRF